MHHGTVKIAAGFAVCLAYLASAQNTQPQKPALSGGDFSKTINPPTKVPTGVILVKGAWSSASDSVTPVPEESRVTNGVLSDPYFGIKFILPSGWAKGYDGPPPSDTGRYILTHLRAADSHTAGTGSITGSILISAQDMFFTPLPATNALQLVNYMKDTLQADYQLEQPLTATKIAGRPFTFFAYWSPVAQLHWYVVATQIRCHALEIVLSSRDTKLLAGLLRDLDKMTLPAEASLTAGTGGGDFPVCMKDYASNENIRAKVDPVFTEHRDNSVPVRIIIDQKGKVKHVHFVSAFPEQAKAITDALFQWRFKPHLQNGQPVEVETGIMFGRTPQPSTLLPTARATRE
jgi:Gram-negative bacterial TonB protein C-terminal